LSWVLSPVASGIVAAIIYSLTKYIILADRATSFARAQFAFPVIVGFTCAVNGAFIIIKGSKGKADDWGTDDIVDNAKNGDGSKLTIICAIVFAVTFGIAAVITPFFVKAIREVVGEGVDYDPTVNTNGYSKDKPAINSVSKEEANQDDMKSAEEGNGAVDPVSQVSKAIMYVKDEITANPHEVLNTDAVVSSIHANAEAHDAQTEEMFKYVQVFTAIVDAFSHGANVSPEP